MQCTIPPPPCTEALANMVVCWMHQHDPSFKGGILTPQLQQHAVALIEHLQLILGEMLNDNIYNGYNAQLLLLPTVLYADLFVGKYGIKYEQIFNLLLTSSILAVKYWDDVPDFKNSQVAEAFNYTLAEINAMERHFLSSINYQLSLSSSQITTFTTHVNQLWRQRVCESAAGNVIIPAVVAAHEDDEETLINRGAQSRTTNTNNTSKSDIQQSCTHNSDSNKENDSTIDNTITNNKTDQPTNKHTYTRSNSHNYLHNKNFYHNNSKKTRSKWLTCKDLIVAKKRATLPGSAHA